MFRANRLAPAFKSLRGLTTKSYIPPNLAVNANAAAASSSTTQESNVDDLVYIYRQLPKGPAPVQAPGFGPFSWYKAKYFGENASPTPVVHLILFLFSFGYYLEYTHHQATHGDHAEH